VPKVIFDTEIGGVVRRNNAESDPKGQIPRDRHFLSAFYLKISGTGIPEKKKLSVPM